eukprot:jgi/Bigna1/142386/aug1.69_g17094
MLKGLNSLATNAAESPILWDKHFIDTIGTEVIYIDAVKETITHWIHQNKELKRCTEKLKKYSDKTKTKEHVKMEADMKASTTNCEATDRYSTNNRAHAVHNKRGKRSSTTNTPESIIFQKERQQREFVVSLTRIMMYHNLPLLFQINTTRFKRSLERFIKKQSRFSEEDKSTLQALAEMYMLEFPISGFTYGVRAKETADIHLSSTSPPASRTMGNKFTIQGCEEPSMVGKQASFKVKLHKQKEEEETLKTTKVDVTDPSGNAVKLNETDLGEETAYSYDITMEGDGYFSLKPKIAVASDIPNNTNIFVKENKAGMLSVSINNQDYFVKLSELKADQAAIDAIEKKFKSFSSFPDEEAIRPKKVAGCGPAKKPSEWNIEHGVSRNFSYDGRVCLDEGGRGDKGAKITAKVKETVAKDSFFAKGVPRTRMLRVFEVFEKGLKINWEKHWATLDDLEAPWPPAEDEEEEKEEKQENVGGGGGGEKEQPSKDDKEKSSPVESDEAKAQREKIEQRRQAEKYAKNAVDELRDLPTERIGAHTKNIKKEEKESKKSEDERHQTEKHAASTSGITMLKTTIPDVRTQGVTEGQTFLAKYKGSNVYVVVPKGKRSGEDLIIGLPVEAAEVPSFVEVNVENSMPGNRTKDNRKKEGYLEKTGYFNTAYKKRFFRLAEDGKLQYFEDEQSVKANGQLYVDFYIRRSKEYSDEHSPLRKRGKLLYPGTVTSLIEF